MKYYHGSRNDSLKELTTDHYGGKLYLTDSYEMALMYAGCSLRSWNYDKEKDLLIIIEMTEKAFDKMYKGKRCYIYTCEVDDAVKDEGNISNHTYLVSHNVLLDEGKYEIEDVYEEFLKLEKEGRIKIIRWEDFTKEQQELRNKRTIERWAPHMENEYKNYREEYDLIVSLIPELKIKKI